MQISLNVKDSFYKQFIELIKSLPSNTIEILNSEENNYLASSQYKKDKEYIQNSLNSVEKGEELIPFNDGLEDLDNFIDNIK